MHQHLFHDSLYNNCVYVKYIKQNIYLYIICQHKQKGFDYLTHYCCGNKLAGYKKMHQGNDGEYYQNNNASIIDDLYDEEM